jgi:hypothetical protein
MPTRNQSGKPSHAFQNPNRKRSKSGKKYEKALERYALIQKKATFPGMEKWSAMTMKKCLTRLKKFGIAVPQA